MNCPWCAFSGSPRGLHAHLGQVHPEAVRFEERGGQASGTVPKSFYAITCPRCGSSYEHQIKPRGRDPGFVEEFAAQIRLVAFDMLVNHLLAEHEAPEAPAPEDEQAEARPEPGVAGLGPTWLVEARKRAAERPGGGAGSDTAP